MSNKKDFLDYSWLRELCFECGVDDVGLVEIDRGELEEQKEDILKTFPSTKTLISYALKLNPTPIRSFNRSVSNHEYHYNEKKLNDIGHIIASKLQDQGVNAINMPASFPMEMELTSPKKWIISHKPIAIEAGLGQMGKNRLIVHPKYGPYILLNTILVDTEVSKYDKPTSQNPCIDCNLCVAACPTGSLSKDNDFNFSGCFTHNYRDQQGGFLDLLDNLSESKNSKDFNNRFKDFESASIWQNLTYGANYKCSYCVAVCPAGENNIASFYADRKKHVSDIVNPLKNKEEYIYVLKNSDAEDYVKNRLPHKNVRIVRNGLKINSVKNFIEGLPVVFQKNRSVGINSVYHFSFTGDENIKTTVIIKNQSIQVSPDHIGTPDICISADSNTWVKFLSKDINILLALISRKIKVKGSPKLLKEFERCFPI